MKTLPLKDAYRFATDHGLAQDVSAIKEMEIEWDLPYTSSVRRGYMVELLSGRKLFDEFKQQYWPGGGTAQGERQTENCLRLKRRYEDFLAGHVDSDEDGDIKREVANQAFALEAHLRDYLAKNLNCVEPGLQLYQRDDRNGVEFKIDAGRIDILAVDQAGRFVVLELKLSKGRNKAVGQLLYYMGWVDAHLGRGPCRGIIVANEITDSLELATRRVEGVSLCRYELSVSIERVGCGSTATH